MEFFSQKYIANDFRIEFLWEQVISKAILTRTLTFSVLIWNLIGRLSHNNYQNYSRLQNKAIIESKNIVLIAKTTGSKVNIKPYGDNFN